MAALFTIPAVVPGAFASNTVTLPLFEPEGFYRDTGGPEVEVRSIPSSYITISINGVYVQDVQVTDPVTGSSLEANKATVKGSWEAYTDDVGIVVNGVPAALSGGVFVASEVPLVAGTNTLTATITTFEEIRDVDSVQVAASATEPAVVLWSNYSSGVAPIQVSFRTDTEGIDAVEYRYDLDGNGVVDIYASDDSAVSYTYQYAGI
ncbi:MAG: hypothetical protein P1S46_04545, partial [bacterium]|nr:hypothetical protein [bacterium]